MYHIIANPNAGSGKSLHYGKILNQKIPNSILHTTTKPKDAIAIAQSIPTALGIIGIGGDGTIQEVVEGIKPNIPLGIFPGGSGNDFARALEGGKKIKPADFLDVFAARVVAGKTRTVDLISANGQKYLVAANMGIDASIVRNAIEYKPKFGGNAYLVAAYKSIMQHTNISMEIFADGERVQQDCTLVAICNNSTYGGGLAIAPMARFDDGMITLCIVNGMSRAKLGMLFPSILVKKHTKLKDIRFINCKEVVIKLDKTTLCLDGNLQPVEGQVHFKVIPQALEIFV